MNRGASRITGVNGCECASSNAMITCAVNTKQGLPGCAVHAPEALAALSQRTCSQKQCRLVSLAFET